MKKRKKIRTDRIIIILVCVFMTSIGLVAVLKSEIFKLTEFEIIGNSILRESEIINSEELITNKNIFSYKLKEIKKYVISNPYIEDAEIKRKLPNKITISIKEKDVIAVLSNEEDLCYIDNNGNLIEKISKLDENNDKIVFKVNYTLEDNIINFKNNEEKKSVLNLLTLLKKEHLQHEIAQIEYDNSNINIKTKIGAEFFIIDDDNLNYNISRTSKILLDLQSKNIKSGVVDLTYSNYAVYKPS